MKRRSLSIRSILLLTLSALAVMIALLVGQDSYTEWRQLANIESLRRANAFSNRLLDISEGLSLERDIAATMLYARDAQTVADLQPRLLESRTSNDADIPAVLQSLNRYTFTELAETQRQVAMHLKEIQTLRQQVDAAIAKPPEARDPKLEKRWYDQTTALIDETETLWIGFVRHFTNINPIVTQQLRYKHFLRIISDYSGRERSIIGRLIVQNAAPTPEESAMLLRGQGAIDLSWKIGLLLAEQSGLYTAIGPAFTDAQSHSENLHNMVRDIFYRPGKHHGTYSLSADLWLELSAQAADSLDTLKNTSRKAIQAYVDALEVKARQTLVVHTLLLLLALGLCTHSFLLVNRRVISPINGMIEALLATIQGRPSAFAIPVTQQSDEIGKLARVLAAFQKNARAVALVAAIVESSDDAIISKSLDGIINSWNSGAEHMFGYSAAEAIGKHIGFIIPPERQAEEADIIGRIRKGESVAHFDTVRMDKQGRMLDISLAISPIRDAAGNIVGASKIARDIAARKAAEQQLKDAAARMEAVFNTVIDGLITIDSQAIIQSFNAAAERIFGYKAEETIGHNVNMLMPEPYHSEHDSYVGNYLHTGTPKVIGIGREVSARRKDGSIFPMELGVGAFTIGTERAFVGMIRDITERKAAEQKILESQQRYRALVEASAQVVWTWKQGVLDKDSPLSKWWEDTTGQPSEAIATFGWLDMVHPDDREHARNIWQDAITNKHSFETEYRLRRRDGTYLYAAIRGVPLLAADGSIREFIGSLNDITARREAEAQLLHYTRDLERSNQELDDFAYIASHDLKEPLRGLFNHASFLMEDYKEKLDADGVHRLQRLSHLSQRMEHLVNDLLYFSRLGRAELAIQDTDPNAVIADIESMMESFLKERNARIVVPKPMPHIVCDKPRITEVFRNLITNAAKYNDKPERLIEVGFLEREGDETSVFYVKDNGIGIDREFFTEIFRIFKRLNRPTEDKESGTGAGLTFVKKIIERHKGRIWLASEPGKGSVFYFTLGKKET